MISKKLRYVRTDGWRGYEEPVNAIAGANDTGTWDDSPCPSHVADAELKKVKILLAKNHIKFVTMTTRSSNVFCVHRYILVAPEDRDRALELAESCVPGTRLLYTVKEKQTA